MIQSYIHHSNKVGVLVEYPSTKEKLFVHPKLMRLLTRDGNGFEPYELSPVPDAKEPIIPEI